VVEVEFQAGCTAPGRQGVLFAEPPGPAPTYRVVDHHGITQARTTALGVALAVAGHLVGEHGDAWICGSDGATAHLDGRGVSSDAPTRPWVRTAASTLTTEENP
jgi:hypothetical protein